MWVIHFLPIPKVESFKSHNTSIIICSPAFLPISKCLPSELSYSARFGFKNKHDVISGLFLFTDSFGIQHQGCWGNVIGWQYNLFKPHPNLVSHCEKKTKKQKITLSVFKCWRKPCASSFSDEVTETLLTHNVFKCNYKMHVGGVRQWTQGRWITCQKWFVVNVVLLLQDPQKCCSCTTWEQHGWTQGQNNLHYNDFLTHRSNHAQISSKQSRWRW